jgi:hypothetical protein
MENSPASARAVVHLDAPREARLLRIFLVSDSFRLHIILSRTCNNLLIREIVGIVNLQSH